MLVKYQNLFPIYNYGSIFQIGIARQSAKLMKNFNLGHCYNVEVQECTRI